VIVIPKTGNRIRLKENLAIEHPLSAEQRAELSTGYARQCAQ
jgi:diketogulonate reductase-like aldo/keto reductase